MISALYVEEGGNYFGLRNVDPWSEERDARRYEGPWPIVAHPPCKRWGRYWGGGPNVRVKRKLGDDGGCFAAALASARRFGGVIEHPQASHAWHHNGLNKPPRFGGWVMADWFGGWTCCVEQGHYGHLARKATWLYAFGCELPTLTWGESEGIRIEDGFRSAEERRVAVAQPGYVPPKIMPTHLRHVTPVPFRDVLISIAESAN